MPTWAPDRMPWNSSNQGHLAEPFQWDPDREVADDEGI